MKLKNYQFFHPNHEKNNKIVFARFNHKWLLKIVLLLALLCSYKLSYAKELTIASDIWCPYICQDAKKPGYIVEMLNDILHQKEFTTKNQTMPLARAIKLLSNGDVDIVLGLTQQHIDQYALIRSNIAVGSFANDFFVNRKNPWRFTTVAALENYVSEEYKIGIIKGYQYGEKINNLITRQPKYFSYSHGDSPLYQNIKRLKSERIAILLDSKNTVLNEVMRSNTTELIYAGRQGTPILLYIALSKPINKQLLQMIDQGIIEYRRSGKLDSLLSNYGIGDWM